MSTAALALLVNIVSIHGKSELMMPSPYDGPYTGDYALALEPEQYSPDAVVVDASAAPTSAAAATAGAAPAQDPEVAYTTLHPVYSRCKAKVDLLGFSLAVQKTCGDIHELTDVAWPCRSAMQDYSKKVRLAKLKLPRCP